ncbi:unnamed protein product [Lymnaea stagnalis]|uniref:Uncharacterized protein n=1 Tax=Lymnaea stagnalis TaxID=6523 RepID=A0AAV2HYL0_LYMST
MYCIFYLLISVQAHALTLTLDEYDQRESETTCTKGLLQDKDYAIFKGTFNWEGSSPEYSRVVELGLQTETLPYIDIICVIQTANTCRGREGKHPCYCVGVDDAKTFHLVFNITATASVSLAKIRLQVSHINKSQIFSETRTLPEIYDRAKSIQINDLVPETEYCFLKLNASDQMNACCHNLPQPCILTISRNSLSVASSVVCSSYRPSGDSPRASIYKFTVSVCGDEHYVQPVTCIAEHGIHLSQNKDCSLEMACKHSTAMFGLNLAILLFLILGALPYMAIILYRKKTRLNFKKRRRNSKETHSDEHL